MLHFKFLTLNYKICLIFQVPNLIVFFFKDLKKIEYSKRLKVPINAHFQICIYIL